MDYGEIPSWDLTPGVALRGLNTSGDSFKIILSNNHLIKALKPHMSSHCKTGGSSVDLTVTDSKTLTAAKLLTF